MNRWTTHNLSFLLMAFLLTAIVPSHVTLAQSDDSAALKVDADAPVVEINARTAGRNFMRLPSLNYRFDLATKCPIDLEPKSISLSVADTRKSLAEADFTGNQAISVPMTIPASQIGPVAVDGFCVADAGDETLRIPAVLSVQASLLCANDEKSQMIYASTSLDVTLSCKRN